MGVIEQIKDSFLYEISWMILGAIIIKIANKVKDNYINYKIKKRIKENALIFERDNIISLDHGDPYYKSDNIILSNSNENHYVNIPKEYVEKIIKIRPEFEVRNNYEYNEKFMKQIELVVGSDYNKLIEKHSLIVAENFLVKLMDGKFIFNGEKYGVYRMDYDRYESDEDSRIMIKYYKTDYFTHQVFRSMYRELKEQRHNISDVSSIESANKFYPFLTSLGVNALLETTVANEIKLVLAKRSGLVNNMDGKEAWHVTMNEGLSITDVDLDEVKLDKCLNRGLREELGIRDEDHKNILSKNFFDLFMNMDDFEIGITSIVKTEFQYDELCCLYSSAQDGEIETTQLMELKVDKQNIKRFLDSYETTKACRYAMEMYIARYKGFF